MKRKHMLAYLLIVCCFYSNNAQSQTRLILNGASINIAQGAYLVVDNPASNAITRTTGYIVSEGENNRLKWNIGTTTGTYTVPCGYSASYIPITFTKTAGTGSGNFLFSTYHTGWQNSTQLPSGVANMNGIAGLDYSAFASDRFWQVNAQGYTTKPTLSNLVLTYTDSENTATNNTITESNLKAYRYNTSLTSWTDNILASTLNTTSKTVTVTSVSVSDLQAWWSVGTLGANRYWVAPSSSSSNLSSNWSASSGGAGGAGVPTLVDVMVFDGGSSAVCVIDANVSAANLSVTAGFGGIISQGTSTITLSNTATLSGGTFIGGSADMLVGGNFTLAGANFTSTAATLELKKDFTVTSGSFAHNNGTVKFSGTAGATQQITGAVVNTFKNITVTNTTASPALRIESNQKIAGILTLASNAVMDADGSANTAIFTLLSTGDSPTLDASIAVLPSGAQVTGNVTVQRFMTKEGANNGRIYRYIGSPIQNATVADIQNEIPITGLFTGSSTCSGCGTNQSMFAYDETVITDANKSGTADLNDGYISFPAVSNTEVLTPGRGYTLYVRGNILSSTAWDVRGPVNAGNVTAVALPVTYTSSGVTANDGWNLVGNPFPSTIDWNATTGWTKANLGGAIYLTDNGNATTKVATWNGVAGTNGGSNYIALGQGFWVKANGAGSPVLTANENIKAAGTQTTFFRAMGTPDLLRITMAKGTEWDDAVINFRADATPGFDDSVDAWKLKNQSFNLSTLTNANQALAINSWSPLICDTPIKISITDAVTGNYSLTFTNFDSFSDSVSLILNDAFLNQSIVITNNKQYLFSVTTDPKSLGTERFLLTFKKTARPITIHSIDNGLMIDYKTNIQWYVNDQPIAGATLPSIVPKVSGTYSVTVNVNGCALKGTFASVITGVEQPSGEVLNVFPNPVSNIVFIESEKNGIESASLMNVVGQSLDEIRATNEQGYKSVSFQMADLPPGFYLLRVRIDNKNYIRKIVKK